jgi:hypothetical protein
LQAEFIESFLLHPWDYFFLAHVFPISTLYISFFIGRRTAKKLYMEFRSMSQQGEDHPQERQLLIIVLMAIISLVLGWYLTIVPFKETGLYAMLFSLPNADIIREKSFKLLDHQLLKYIFSLMSNTLAPLTVIFISFEIKRHLSPLRLSKLALYFVSLCFVLIVVSIYGAKAPALMLLFTIALAFYFRSGLPFRPTLIAFVGLILLIVPMVMSLLINKGEFDLGTVVSYYGDILDRTFGRIAYPGLWHVDFAQREGYIGVAGIPKLATLLNIEPIDSFNVIGKTYIPNAFESISAGASFIFVNYSYFGLLAFMPCLIALLFLDGLLQIYINIDQSIRIPIIACCSTAVINLIQTQFTTVLFTGGLVPLLLVGMTWTAFIKSLRLIQQSYAKAL